MIQLDLKNMSLNKVYATHQKKEKKVYATDLV